MESAPLNLKADENEVKYNFVMPDDLYDLGYVKGGNMNTYKVVRALNHIIDVIYDTIDALIADYDIDIEEVVENE